MLESLRIFLPPVRRWGIALCCAASFCALLGDARVAASSESITIQEGLVLRGYDWYRSAGSIDPVESNVVAGTWSRPMVGGVVASDMGDDRRWRRVVADEDGWLAGDEVQGGYVYIGIEEDRERVALLEAMAHRMVYVNGEPRAGNLYQYKETWESWEPRFDYSLVPILLSPGTNDLLFQGGRLAGIKVRIHEPRSVIMINERDITAPDLVVGRPIDDWAAVALINASASPADDLVLIAALEDGEETRLEVPTIQPLSIFKTPFRIHGGAPALPGERRLRISVVRRDGQAVFDEQEIVLAARRPNENHKRTFVSGIDGSVQYFAMNPAQNADSAAALFLSVHGAAVEAINQSGAYKAKSWGHIVAPTNRRPYGFNWEDWGRVDAIEVLEIAVRTLGVDSRRVYLTGHSMGGHGAWHIGALYPDRFAAVGPSAGWISFWSYRPSRGVEADTPVDKMLMRATSPSRTMALAKNLEPLGVYVLHGADDDNVPATESRRMVSHLDTFHKDLIYHEEPDAGHWWDKSDEDGADCVDWFPMFDFFAHHTAPASDEVRRVRFRTPSPGVSSRNHWVRIEAQTKQLEMSSVDIRFDPGKRRFVGHTENVQRMTFDLTHIEPSAPITVELDGQSLRPIDFPTRASALTIHRVEGKWVDTRPAPPTTKGPHRYGTFKNLFNHRVVLVYGTKGTKEENDWAFTKARYDAETFWYQANGSIKVVRDIDFDPRTEPDRNVVLYGNEKTNAAWSLVREDKIRIRPGEIRIGKKKIKGKDLGVLIIRPRRGSRVACVGAVGGTGIVGMRLTDRRPYLQAGFAYPDLAVFCPPENGDAGSIVCGAGFFGLDWRAKSGEFVWTGRAD
jgi:poly(3-hydroxybutyrate) depolymerase